MVWMLDIFLNSGISFDKEKRNSETEGFWASEKNKCLIKVKFLGEKYNYILQIKKNLCKQSFSKSWNFVNLKAKFHSIHPGNRIQRSDK